MRSRRMIKGALVAVLLLSNTFVNGQTFSEWFRQKKTQIKYLLEQIAQLQVQIELLKKGYKIVDNGLRTIHQIKDGEFNLHNDFFNSLKSINSNIANYADVADIIATQTALISSCDHILSNAISSRQFTKAELELFTKSLDHFKKEVRITLDELMQVATANKLEMTDNERIVRIDKLKEQSNEQRTSIQKMTNQLDITIRWRLTEAGEIGLLRKLYSE